jgi:purine nucleosidase/pyrimidine-specific ribonucleoside hydrolase
MQQKIWLDTDIGDDVDDALALGLVCGLPELELVGVSTVFGNVAARSRQTRTILAVAGGKFRDIPVAAGCGASLASRPYDNIRAYLEGHLPNQDSTCLPESELPPPHPRHGVDLLIETLLAGDGDIIPITIGAMTNLAMALTKERRIAAKIPRIVVMAAEFKRGFAEYNIRCDPEAAALVFQSGIPIDVTPWNIGDDAKFAPEHIARLAASDRPMARHLAQTIRAWQENAVGQNAMPSLFDPMAVATMVKPELVEWKQGTVRVELRGEHTYGFTTFQEHEIGRHRVAWNVAREPAQAFYLERVLAV